MTQAQTETTTDTQTESDAKATEERYYILDARSIVGNCCGWWRPDGKGYTCNLEEAGLYSYEQAHRQRDTDIPIPEALAKELAVTHVHWDTLRARLKLAVHPKIVK